MKLRSRTWQWFGRNAAVFVALFALAYSIYQGALMRQHDRVTVKPLLSLYVSLGTAQRFDKHGLYLENVGPGVAYVDPIRARFLATDEEKRSCPSLWEQSEHAFAQLAVCLNQTHPALPLLSYSLGVLVLGPGQAVCLLGYPKQEASEGRILELRDILHRLTVTVPYRSVYDDPGTATYSGENLPIEYPH